jgi:hypothetical protein
MIVEGSTLDCRECVIDQSGGWIRVDGCRFTTVERLMRTLVVAGSDVPAEFAAHDWDRLVVFGLDLVALDEAARSFDEHDVRGATGAVHADLHIRGPHDHAE